MTMTDTQSTISLRVVFPQWQACGADYAKEFTKDLAQESVRHGYEVGAPLLDALFPATDDETVVVPVADYDTGVEQGIESRSAVLENLRAASALIRQRDPQRITTFGGDCSTGIPSFTHLAARYGDDLAVVWLDSHPDCSTPGGNYQGFHDMALAHITGHGDPEILAELPAAVDPRRVVLAGTHSWNDDEKENFERWGIQRLSPDQLRESPQPLLDHLARLGCTKLALHVDVDCIDARQFHLGMGAEPGGLSASQARAVVTALSEHPDLDVVGLTVGEFIPRQVLAVRELLGSVPLL